MSKDILDRLLAGMGIRHVGNRTAAVVSGHFGSIDALLAASEEELSEVMEIGPVKLGVRRAVKLLLRQRKALDHLAGVVEAEDIRFRLHTDRQQLLL